MIYSIVDVTHSGKCYEFWEMVRALNTHGKHTAGKIDHIGEQREPGQHDSHNENALLIVQVDSSSMDTPIKRDGPL